MPCFDNKTHERRAWVPANVRENRHAAEGVITVAGGAFTSAGEVIVGADGAGAIEMVGKAGSFTAQGLVLSNATSSAARFVAGPDGFSPITVNGALSVTDGASVEVDLSAYTGSSSVFRLFAAGSLAGNLEDVSIRLLEADGPSRKPCRLRHSNGGIDLAMITGTAVIIR